MRSSAFGRRRGVFVRFMVFGGTNLRGKFVNLFNSGQNDLSEDYLFYEQSLWALGLGPYDFSPWGLQKKLGCRTAASASARGILAAMLITSPYHAGHDRSERNRLRSVIPHQGLRDLAV